MVKDGEGSLVNFAHRQDPMDVPLQPVLVNVRQSGKATVGAQIFVGTVRKCLSGIERSHGQRARWIIGSTLPVPLLDHEGFRQR